MLGAAVLGCLTGLVTGMFLIWLAPSDGPAGPAGLTWIPLDTGLATARALFDVAGVATVGLTLVPLLLRGARPRDGDPVLVRARRAVIVVGAGWAVAAGLLCWLHVAVALNTRPLDVPIQRFGDYLGAAVAGRALVVAGLCGLAVAVAGAVAARRPERVPVGIPAVLAMLGVLALPATGHAATAPVHDVAVLAVAVHVVAAAAWIGGLGALAWLVFSRRELLAGVLPRYSRLATTCLVAVAATGVLGATLRLPSTVALLSTSYGAMVLGKGIGVVALGLLGARARFRLLPEVAARRTARPIGWLTVELALMGAVLGLASVLAQTTPPV